MAHLPGLVGWWVSYVSTNFLLVLYTTNLFDFFDS